MMLVCAISDFIVALLCCLTRLLDMWIVKLDVMYIACVRERGVLCDMPLHHVSHVTSQVLCALL